MEDDDSSKAPYVAGSSERPMMAQETLANDNGHHETRVNNSPKTDAAARKSKAIYDNFMKTILEFNRRNNTPIHEQPQIGGKVVNLYILYGYVLKAGGSQTVNERKHWDKVSASLGFPGQGDAVAEIHQRCLRAYEKEWLAKRKLAQARGARDSAEASPSQQQQKSMRQSTPDVSNGGHVDKTHSRQASAVRNATQTPTIPPPKASLNAYRPLKRSFDTYAGLDLATTVAMTKDAAKLRPFPAFPELGRLDVQAVTRSIESGLPAEMGNALDMMVVIAGDRRWGLPLLHCADLPEVLVECLMNAILELRKLAGEVTFETAGYAELIDSATHTTNHLLAQETSRHLLRHDTSAALQRVMSVMTILRNLAFTEVNQETIARAHGLVGALSAGLSFFASDKSQTMMLPSSSLDFIKDVVTLISLVGHFLIIDNQKCMQDIFQVLLTFVPDTSQIAQDTTGSLCQEPYIVAVIDALAKILTRDVPNRQCCESLLAQKGATFTQTSLDQMMTLALLVLPKELTDRNVYLLAQRVPLLQHSLILAELAADMVPPGNVLPSKWLDNQAELPLRLSILIQIVSDRSFSRGLIGPAEIAILKRRAVSIVKIVLEKSGNMTTSVHGNSSITRLQTLVDTNEADLQI